MTDPRRPEYDYCFSNWRYSPDRRELSGPEGTVRLKPLLDRLLRRLMDASGSMLMREQLIAEVWTRREVNDEVLSRAIAELRSVLGDDARDPGFIETLTKGGYRWIAPVQRDAGHAGAVPTGKDAPAATADRSWRNAALWTIAALSVLAGIAALLWRAGGPAADDRTRLAVDLLHARPLATDTRLELDPRFDSTGRVVYIRTDPASGSSELVLLDPATQAERVLWQEAGELRHPAPAPDGREVAVLRKDELSCELWSVSLVDARRSRLGDCAVLATGGLEWTDSGNTLLYTGSAADDQHAPGLIQIDRRTNRQDRLTSPDAREGAHVDPRISADGKTLVYASMQGNERQLWKTDWPLQQHRIAMLKRPEPVYGHAFEPHGDALWVAGDLTLYRALHRIGRDGEPQLIGGRGARSIDLARNGAAVWSEANYDADIWLRQAAGSTWKTIARSNRYEAQPAFSMDGNHVALVSNRHGAESVLVYNLLDGRSRPLSLDPNYRWVRPTWSSAQEQTLIITAYEDEQTRLYRYRLDADVATPISEVEPGAFHGVELADRLLYLNGHGTDQSTLMQLASGGSLPENLGLGPVASFRASPSWLVWRGPGSNDLHAARLPELESLRAIPRGKTGLDEAFAISGDVVCFLNNGSLWTFELPDGPAMPMTVERLPNGSGPNLAVSGTGAMAVVNLSSTSIDLMYAEGTQPER